MKWALIALGIMAGIVAVVVLIGALLPRDHVAAVTARIPAPPSAVWNAISDVANYATWRSDVTRIEMLPPAPSGPSWREHTKNDAITMVIDEADPPRRMVARIADPNLPFGGKWTYEIAPESDGAASRITITEHGSVYNPVFRFVSRFIMGHTATLETYVRALGKHFGTDVTPTVVTAEANGTSRG